MTTTNETASQAYAKRRSDIARLIDVLQMELDAHAKRAALAEKHWGYPGDLGRIREGMIELVMSMSGMERERIEDFLAEADDADAN
ncbi:MAG: hypothetical protein AAFX79_03235 [Planctomycetota bacterium]|jgi:hypothetical protein|nr:hypothetical protein [bacterium]